MGPDWHLEKLSKSVDSDQVFAIVVFVKLKSESAALDIISLNKAHAIQQLSSEYGALRYSINPPHKVGVEGVGATEIPPTKSDELLTVTWIESFESREAYELHKTIEHVAALDGKLKDLIDGEVAVFGVRRSDTHGQTSIHGSYLTSFEAQLLAANGSEG